MLDTRAPTPVSPRYTASLETRSLPPWETTAWVEPSDPAGPPVSEPQHYLGCVLAPDAASPDGWRRITPEVEVWEYQIGRAAVRLISEENVAIGADEILALRLAGRTEHTCFLSQRQVRLALLRISEAITEQQGGIANG